MKPMIPKDKKIKSTLKYRAGRHSTAATQSMSPVVVKSNMYLKGYPLEANNVPRTETRVCIFLGQTSLFLHRGIMNSV